MTAISELEAIGGGRNMPSCEICDSISEVYLDVRQRLVDIVAAECTADRATKADNLLAELNDNLSKLHDENLEALPLVETLEAEVEQLRAFIAELQHNRAITAVLRPLQRVGELPAYPLE